MLAFPEILKTLTPVKRFFSKGSASRKHFFERLTDLVTIILSIYLALTIEGWAEKRIEHKRLMQYYHNLRDEIAKDSVSLTEVIADAENHINSTKSHIGILRAYNSTLQDSVAGFFRGMLSSEVFYSSEMISYQAMVLSGDIRLIEDLKVKQKLIELEEAYKGLKIYEELYLTFITEDLTRAYAESFDLLDMKLIEEDNFTQTGYRNLVAEFLSLNLTRQQQYRASLKVARETLALFQQESGKKK